MNLQVLKKSRKQPLAGDVFTYRIDEHYRFGLVVLAGEKLFGVEDMLLVYLYSYKSEQPSLDRQLNCEDLLVPPLVTYDGPWTRGFFETIGHLPISSQDLLKKHCFADYDGIRFYDEFWNKLPGRSEPCGEKGIFTERGIDQMLSEALGLRIPTDEDYMEAGSDDGQDEDSAESHFVEIVFNPEDLAASGIEDLMTVEEALDEAFEETDGKARWTGNGISEDLVHVDVEVDRGYLKQTAKLIRKVLKKLQAPASTYLNVDGKRQELDLLVD